MESQHQLGSSLELIKSMAGSLCVLRCEEYFLHCFDIHKSSDKQHELALAKDGSQRSAPGFSIRVGPLIEVSRSTCWCLRTVGLVNNLNEQKGSI